MLLQVLSLVLWLVPLLLMLSSSFRSVPFRDVVLCCFEGHSRTSRGRHSLRTITETSLEGLEVETREICNFKKEKKVRMRSRGHERKSTC